MTDCKIAVGLLEMKCSYGDHWSSHSESNLFSLILADLLHVLVG